MRSRHGARSATSSRRSVDGWPIGIGKPARTKPPSPKQSQRELQRAAKELVDELSRGFSAIGATIRDEEAKRDLGDAVSAIGDAITATVNEASEGIRSGRTGSAGDSAEGSADSGSAGGTDGPEERDDR